MPPLTYTDEQYIDAVNDLKIASTGDVAKVVGCQPRNAGIRLGKLCDAGKISKQNIGKRWIWMPTRTEKTK